MLQKTKIRQYKIFKTNLKKKNKCVKSENFESGATVETCEERLKQDSRLSGS